MRYRQLDKNGDYSFGLGVNSFYINTPQTVAQAVATRLKLLQGEWYYDTTDGTPWNTQVLGRNTQGTRDLVLKARVLETPGVKSIVNYSSQLTPDRKFTVNMTIDTIYGQIILAGPV